MAAFQEQGGKRKKKQVMETRYDRALQIAAQIALDRNAVFGGDADRRRAAVLDKAVQVLDVISADACDALKALDMRDELVGKVVSADWGKGVAKVELEDGTRIDMRLPARGSVLGSRLARDLAVAAPVDVSELDKEEGTVRIKIGDAAKTVKMPSFDSVVGHRIAEMIDAVGDRFSDDPKCVVGYVSAKDAEPMLGMDTGGLDLLVSVETAEERSAVAERIREMAAEALKDGDGD